MELFGGCGGTLGASFMLYVLGAIGDFVIDLLDFKGEVKFIGMLCVFFEKRVTFGFQVVAFFLPDTCNCEHVVTLASSVRSFLVCRYSCPTNCAEPG